MQITVFIGFIFENWKLIRANNNKERKTYLLNHWHRTEQLRNDISIRG